MAFVDQAPASYPIDFLSPATVSDDSRSLRCAHFESSRLTSSWLQLRANHWANHSDLQHPECVAVECVFLSTCCTKIFPLLKELPALGPWDFHKRGQRLCNELGKD